jgi:hypothetical protein
MANRLESFLNDEFVNKEDKNGTNGFCENSFLLSIAQRLSHAFPNPVRVAAA